MLALVCGAIGIGFAPILAVLSEAGPSATAFFRLLFALPVLWGWMFVEQRNDAGRRRPKTARDFGLLFLAGLFFTGDLSLWHWSLQFTSVANSTLLANLTPLFVTLGARLLFSEKITRLFLAAMGLALAGAVMLVGAPSAFSEHLRGEALALSAAVFYAGYLLCVKRLREQFSAVTIMSWSGLVSSAGFWIAAHGAGEQIRPESGEGWLILVALALVSHVGGQTLIAYAFGHLPAGFSSLNLLLQPIVAAILAWVLLGQAVQAWQIAGGFMILAALALASRAKG